METNKQLSTFRCNTIQDLGNLLGARNPDWLLDWPMDAICEAAQRSIKVRGVRIQDAHRHVEAIEWHVAVILMWPH